jgi:hypothetical protein
MEVTTSLIEPLLQSVETYGKISFELLKLKSLDKAADVSSTLLSRLILTLILSLFVFSLNISIALWLGDILGKNYYGFLIIALFYGFTGIILYFIHPIIIARVNNFIITQMFN